MREIAAAAGSQAKRAATAAADVKEVMGRVTQVASASTEEMKALTALRATMGGNRPAAEGQT